MKKLTATVSIITALTTVALSMVLNVWAFNESSPGLFATSVGVLLPVWILALTLIGKYCWEHDNKIIGGAAYALAGFSLIVSLPHLAHGFDKITNAHAIESWSLALVTDLCQIVMKMVLIKITREVSNVESKTDTKKNSKKKNRKKKEVSNEVIHLAS